MASKIDIDAVGTWTLAYSNGDEVILRNLAFKDAMHAAWLRCGTVGTRVRVYSGMDEGEMVQVATQTLRGPEWVHPDYQAAL